MRFSCKFLEEPLEALPGFRMNADGSIRDASTPPAQLHPSAGGNPPGAFDQFGTNPFASVGDGTLPPYLVYSPGQFNGLGKVPADDEGEPGGMSLSRVSNSPFPSGSSADNFPIMAPPSPLPSGRPDAGDELRPSTTSLGYTANPAASPLQPVFGAPPPEDGSSRATTGLGNGAVLPEWPASDGPRSATGQTADPNIVRVGNRDSVTPPGNVQIAQAPEKPQSKLRKDPSPGVVVVLPDKSTIPDP